MDRKLKHALLRPPKRNKRQKVEKAAPQQPEVDFSPVMAAAVEPRMRNPKRPHQDTKFEIFPRGHKRTHNLLAQHKLAAILGKEDDGAPEAKHEARVDTSLAQVAPITDDTEVAGEETESDTEDDESADSPDQQRNMRSAHYTGRIREQLRGAGLDVQEVDTFDANGERTLVVRLNDTVSDSALVKVSEIGVKLKKKRPAIAFLPPRHKWVMAFMSMHEAALNVRSDKISDLSFVRMHWQNRGFSLEPLDGLSALDTFIGQCTVVRDALRAHSASSSGGKRPGLRPAASADVAEEREGEEDAELMQIDPMLGQRLPDHMALAAVAAAASFDASANADSGSASVANSPSLGPMSILPSQFDPLALDIVERATMASASVAYAAAEVTGGIALMHLGGAQLDSAGPRPPPVMAAPQPYIPPAAQDQPADVSLD